MNTFEQSYDNMYYKTGTVVQEEKIFKFRECTLICNFVIIFPCKKVWPSGSGDDFSNLLMFFAISLLSPFGKDLALHLNKLENPSPRDDLI